MKTIKVKKLFILSSDAGEAEIDDSFNSWEELEEEIKWLDGLSGFDPKTWEDEILPKLKAGNSYYYDKYIVSAQWVEIEVNI